jgi:hypothetical protein
MHCLNGGWSEGHRLTLLSTWTHGSPEHVVSFVGQWGMLYGGVCGILWRVFCRVSALLHPCPVCMHLTYPLTSLCVYTSSTWHSDGCKTGATTDFLLLRTPIPNSRTCNSQAGFIQQDRNAAWEYDCPLGFPDGCVFDFMAVAQVDLNYTIMLSLSLSRSLSLSHPLCLPITASVLRLILPSQFE